MSPQPGCGSKGAGDQQGSQAPTLQASGPRFCSARRSGLTSRTDRLLKSLTVLSSSLLTVRTLLRMLMSSGFGCGRFSPVFVYLCPGSGPLPRPGHIVPSQAESCHVFTPTSSPLPRPGLALPTSLSGSSPPRPGSRVLFAPFGTVSMSSSSSPPVGSVSLPLLLAPPSQSSSGLRRLCHLGTSPGALAILFTHAECLSSIAEGCLPSFFEGPYDDVAFIVSIDGLRQISSPPTPPVKARGFEIALSQATLSGDLLRLCWGLWTLGVPTTLLIPHHLAPSVQPLVAVPGLVSGSSCTFVVAAFLGP